MSCEIYTRNGKEKRKHHSLKQATLKYINHRNNTAPNPPSTATNKPLAPALPAAPVNTGAAGPVVVPLTSLTGTDVVCDSLPAGAAVLGDGAAGSVWDSGAEGAAGVVGSAGFVGPDVAGWLDAGPLGAGFVFEGCGAPGELVSIGQTVV